MQSFEEDIHDQTGQTQGRYKRFSRCNVASKIASENITDPEEQKAVHDEVTAIVRRTTRRLRQNKELPAMPEELRAILEQHHEDNSKSK